MTVPDDALPEGYVSFDLGHTRIVTLHTAAESVLEAMHEGTLYDWARQHPRARSYIGRGMSYAVPLPGSLTTVVVRHSRHGGLLARLTGDRFLRATRAPRELQVSVRLRAAGVPTPEIVAYATYSAGGPFRRADVATREINPAKDLGTVLMSPQSERARGEALAATAELLLQMSAAGAKHPDLNLKNVLIATREGTTTAFVLDVDTVDFDRPGADGVGRRNARRLLQSITKWQRLYGLQITEAEMAALARAHLAGVTAWHPA